MPNANVWLSWVQDTPVKQELQRERGSRSGGAQKRSIGGRRSRLVIAARMQDGHDREIGGRKAPRGRRYPVRLERPQMPGRSQSAKMLGANPRQIDDFLLREGLLT